MYSSDVEYLQGERERDQFIWQLAIYVYLTTELTVVAEECDVNIVAHAHQPEGITQESRNEPRLAY